MAQHEIVKDIGLTLKKLLEDNFAAEGYRDVEIYTTLPTEENIKKLPAINLFLVAVTVDSRHRERSPVLVSSTEKDGRVREYMTSPPTVMWLYYMLSAWGKSAQEEHVLLALAMKILMENPSIQEEGFEGASLRSGERLPILVVEESEFGYEETMAFWRSIGEPVRPGVQYRVGARLFGDKPASEIRRAIDLQLGMQRTERSRPPGRRR
ncbi:MAG: DUF4255 domain-containing protein [Bradymonadales bacterium]|nr:DUF4255 domain-containing protein [Bradymonadales bacterium]